MNTVFTMGSNASNCTDIGSGIACCSNRNSFSNWSLVLLHLNEPWAVQPLMASLHKIHTDLEISTSWILLPLKSHEHDALFSVYCLFSTKMPPKTDSLLTHNYSIYMHISIQYSCSFPSNPFVIYIMGDFLLTHNYSIYMHISIQYSCSFPSNPFIIFYVTNIYFPISSNLSCFNYLVYCLH